MSTTKAAEAQKARVEKYGIVLCDDCCLDWSDRSGSGGLVYASYAICPTCAPRWLAGIEAYSQQHLIKALCPPGESFGAFIRTYRLSRKK